MPASARIGSWNNYWELIDLVLGARKLAPAIREAMRSVVVKGTYTQMELNLDDLNDVGIEL